MIIMNLKPIPLVLLLFMGLLLNGSFVSAQSFDFQTHRLSSYLINNYFPGTSFEIARSTVSDSLDHLYVDLFFKNHTEQKVTFEWFDFKESWGIPLSCEFSVERTDTTGIKWQDTHWSEYMDRPVYARKEKIRYFIELEPYETITKTIRVWWPGMKVGTYDLQIKFYNKNEKGPLISNKLELSLDKVYRIKIRSNKQ